MCIAKSKNMAVLFQAVFVLIGMFYSRAVFFIDYTFFITFFSPPSVFNHWRGGLFFSSSLHVFFLLVCVDSKYPRSIYTGVEDLDGALELLDYGAQNWLKNARFSVVCVWRLDGRIPPLYNWIDTFARLIIADKLLPKRAKTWYFAGGFFATDSYNGIFESLTTHYSNWTWKEVVKDVFDFHRIRFRNKLLKLDADFLQ